MQQAAEGLDYKYKPGVIVVVTKRPAGTHLAAETEEDLVEALDKTLGCPMVTQRLEAVWPTGDASSL